MATGLGDKRLQVHFCGEDCEGALTDPKLLHGNWFERVDLKDLPWMTNLESAVPKHPSPEIDDLAALRKMQEEAAKHDKGASKERKKKEKKRRRRDDSRGEEEREEASPKKKEVTVEPGQKSLSSVFGGTGLDPNPARRQRVLRRAKRLGRSHKKKKKKSSSSKASGSSSSSTSSSSSRMGVDTGLFDGEDKLQRIWKKCPGALTTGALREARQGLLSQAGTLWNVDQGELPPVFTQYCRQQILAPMTVSPVLTQELLTLSQALDLLLQGRVASTADVLCQRIKCVESLAKGYHWSVGRQLELVRSDQFSIAEGSEALSAARKAKEEERLRSLVSKGAASKGGDNYSGGKGGRKGKDGKPMDKGRPDAGGKNRGGDQRARDDGKPGKKS